MELFDRTTGCFTDEGLDALLAGCLDEAARLEAAEHLAFCDRCMDRYTARLTGEALMEPPADLRRPVLARLRQRMILLVTNRYATAAAAVVLAFSLWGCGLFQGLVPSQEALFAPPTLPVSQQAPRPGLDDALWQAGDAFSGLLDRFSDRLASAVTAPFAHAPAAADELSAATIIKE